MMSGVNQAIAISVSVVIILVIINVLTASERPLLAAQRTGQGTEVSMMQFITVLTQFDTEKPTDVPSGKAVPGFYVEKGFYMVGFSADDDAIYDSCAKVQVERPVKCPTGSACVCLCVQGKVCKDYVPDCTPFKYIKRLTVQNLADGNFLSPARPTGGNQLLVYGSCGWTSSTLTPTLLYIYPAAENMTVREIIIDSKSQPRIISTTTAH